jgi:hypothetical protein
MKLILGRLALLLLVMLIGVSIGRRTEMPMQQQSALSTEEFCACGPGPGILIRDAQGRERLANRVCNCVGRE